MEQLRKAFEAQVGKPLVTVIEKETGGWFEYGLRGLVLGPVGFDVWLLHRACDGAGTHEDILTEVLVGRTNEEIEAIKAEYQRVYHKNLLHVIQGELTFKTERMFNMILAVRFSLDVSDNRRIVPLNICQWIHIKLNLISVTYTTPDKEEQEPMKSRFAVSSSIDQMHNYVKLQEDINTIIVVPLKRPYNLNSPDTCKKHYYMLFKVH
jgi:hypothetical protein